jgi:hypothetical protein
MHWAALSCSERSKHKAASSAVLWRACKRKLLPRCRWSAALRLTQGSGPPALARMKNASCGCADSSRCKKRQHEVQVYMACGAFHRWHVQQEQRTHNADVASNESPSYQPVSVVLSHEFPSYAEHSSLGPAAGWPRLWAGSVPLGGLKKALGSEGESVGGKHRALYASRHLPRGMRLPALSSKHIGSSEPYHYNAPNKAHCGLSAKY